MGIGRLDVMPSRKDIVDDVWDMRVTYDNEIVLLPWKFPTSFKSSMTSLLLNNNYIPSL